MARVLASLLLATANLSPQNTTFQSGISLVHVDAEVLSSDNRILTGFSKQDFRIFDDGHEQPILNMLREEQPLDLILLFDISASMRGVVREVASAADTGLQQLRTGDRVSVMVFNTRSTVIAPLTADLSDVERTIRLNVTHQHFGGGTAIQTAVNDAALRFLDESPSERRRAVLIITDNIGVRTRHESSVVHDFWRVDAPLSGLIVADPAYKTAHKINNIIAPQTLLLEAGMKGIAEKTGGDTIESGSPGAAFADMLHRIRTRYSLYYRMPQTKSGQARTIKVELASDAAKRFPDARIRARHGYIAP
jgi:VWFA-related protein